MVKLRNLVQSSDIKILRYNVKFLCVENNTESSLPAISPWSRDMSCKWAALISRYLDTAVDV